MDVSASGVRIRSIHAKFGKARVVPLRREVADATRQQIEAKHCGGTAPLWRQTASAARKYLTQACKRADIKPICMHDLRRTFGTRCAMAGMPMVTLKDIMGHSSAEVTVKYYVDLRQRDLESALRAVDLGIGIAVVTKPGTFVQRIA